MTAYNTGKGNSQSNFWEQVVTVLVTIAATLLAFAVGAPDKWLAAIFLTVVTFAGMISYFKKRWSSLVFWKVMACLFLVHLVLVWLAFAVLLSGKRDVGLLPSIPVIFVEAFLIYHAVLFLSPKFGK